ncbi:hypothetical protein NIES2111_67840 (plasmid) [Nostoc sp. NIES-2111]|nr:hypothetical protein NIES2111_67840 [Nostoc sp. NIES-2111]
MKASNSSRGLDLDSPSLFCSSYVTKSELARILNIARSTLVSWDSIALYRIESYRQAYPVKANGSTDRSCPLSPYQSWVLSRVGRVMQNLKSAERVKNYIKKYPQEFSPAKFQAQFNQVTKGNAA